MRKIRIFIINGIILTISSFLMRAVTMGFSVYISNKVGAEAIGVFQLIISVYMFFITIATSGIKLATTKVISEEFILNQNAGTKKAMRQCLLYSLIFGGSAGIILFLMAPYITTTWIHNKVHTSIFYILAFALPCMSITSVINGYFSALRDVIKTASAQIVEEFVQIIIATFLLSLFLPKGLSYACLALILGMVISEFVACIYLYILYKFDSRKFGYRYKNNSDYKRKIFAIAMPISITSYIRSAISTLKQILIPIRLEKSGLSCDQALANYGIITGMAMPIIMFPYGFVAVFGELLITEITEYSYTNSYKQIKYVIKKVFRLAITFSILAFIILLLFGDNISLLLYNNTEVAFYLKALALLAPLMYMDNVIDNILKGLNAQFSVMVINIFDLIITTSLIFFILPIYGANGYISILIISEAFNLAISLLVLTTHLKKHTS